MAIPLVCERSDSPAAAADWQTVLARAIRSPGELCRLLGLAESVAAEAAEAAEQFPVLVPRTLLGRLGRQDPNNPILRQVLPRPAELGTTPGFSADPLAERSGACVPGLLQKYRGRSLMVATSHCGVHCRYCFRRHFPFDSGTASADDWQPALRQLAQDPSIHEVILSGGDPLTLPDAELSRLADRLAAIEHLRRLRVHTRLPILVPSRVVPALTDWLRGTRLAPVVVVQVNHREELDSDAAVALTRLIDAGVPLLSQSVLLRGVNDSVDAMAALFERLIDLRVMPYYLHQLDRVAGAAQFEVPENHGKTLIAAIRERLPGYAVPRYVRQPSRGRAKRLLA